MKLLPATHSLAHAVGSDRYFTGKLCRRGHRSERYTRGGACVECMNPGGKGNLQIPADSSAAMAALHDEFERAKGECSERFAAAMAEQEREHAKLKADLRRALLDATLSPRHKGEVRLQLIDLDEAHKARCEALHAEAKTQAVSLRETFEQRAFALRTSVVSTALETARREEESRALECEWRAALADLKRSARRVESALLAFHKKSSLFSAAAMSGRKGDADLRRGLYEEVQLQIKHARKAAESDPNGTNWTRAFHEHHAAGVQLAIERLLPWNVDPKGKWPTTGDIAAGVERVRSLRDKLAKAEQIMRARMPDPAVFPALLFEDVGEVRDVRRYDADFNAVMRMLDEEACRPPRSPVPQLTEKPFDDDMMLERLRELSLQKMEWK